MAVNMGFLDRSDTSSFMEILDSVPDPLLLRKSGSAGNRTRDPWICSQEL
jgi:hypothetical protein